MNRDEFAITVNGLEKSFKQGKVLGGIHFKVKKGTIFALLGSNGAGKTTTVKVLSTLMKPGKGGATISGFDIVKEPEAVRQAISLTGQYAAVDELLTGRENMRLIGSLLHILDVSARANKLLEQFDLLYAADRRVATYSGGMRRRLDLAMSLIGNASVIFLDEPTTGLDPQSRIAMWTIIRDLTKSGVTVFLTTQYLEEADQLADHIAVLDGGKIIAEGTASELKKRLPGGYIELEFDHGSELSKAYQYLRTWNMDVYEQQQVITVRGDGSVQQLMFILNQLEYEKIHVKSVIQKQPTLEDVFFELIGNNHKGERV